MGAALIACASGAGDDELDIFTGVKGKPPISGFVRDEANLADHCDSVWTIGPNSSLEKCAHRPSVSLP